MENKKIEERIEMDNAFKDQVNLIRKLENENDYKEATKATRKLSCAHLTPTGDEKGVKEQGMIFSYSNMNGPCLLASGVEFGKSSKDLGWSFGKRLSKNGEKKYTSWYKNSKLPLDDLYKCALTGSYCIARKTEFHSSDIPPGNHHETYIEINCQKRCPAYKSRLELKV